MGNMVETFVTNAEENLNKALHYANNIVNAGNKTEILNAQYYMGQFSAYMDMIEMANMKKYIEIGEKTKATRDIILKAIDKLYK